MKPFSTDPKRAPARAMMRATGWTDSDFNRPKIAVVNTWTEVTPCNMHLRTLGEAVKRGKTSQTAQAWREVNANQ